MFSLKYATIGESVIEADGSEVEGKKADDKDLRQWGVERISLAIETFTAAAAVCDRLETLPLQILEIEKMGGSERTLEVRTGDFVALRRGVETFVEGMPAAKEGEGMAGGGGGGASYMTGWGRGQEGVVERIMRNRGLLAGVYRVTEGLENVLAQQRELTTQRRRNAGAPGGRTPVREGDERRAARGEDATDAPPDVGSGSVSMNDVPEGLLKETVDASSQPEVDVMVEGEKVERKGEVVEASEESPEIGNPEAIVTQISSTEADSVTDSTIEIESLNSSALIPEVTSSPNSPDDVLLSDRNSDDNESEGEGGEKEVNQSSSAPFPESAESSEEDETSKERETSKESETEILRTKLFFLSVTDDSAYVRDNYTGSNSGDDDSRGDSRVFDTTVESSEKDTEKIIIFLAASLDVMFFLVETIVKTAGPILAGGGALAADRAAEALFSDNVSTKKFLRKNRPRETVGADTGASGKSKGKTWKLLSEFKKQM